MSHLLPIVFSSALSTPTFALPLRQSSRSSRLRPKLFLGSLFCILVCTAVVRADLKPKDARKSITRMPGFELTNGAVRVKSITMSTGTTAEAVAELRTVFKFQKDEQGNWRVAELRTKPNRWEAIDFMATALGAQITSNPCIVSDPPFKGSSSVQPSMRRARCLLGSLLGVEVPSDVIRIQEVSPLEIPLGDRPSAVVVAWVRVDARLVNGSKGWQVTELRTGSHNWVNLDNLTAAVNEKKCAQVRAELVATAKALESFRQDRGSYVISDSHVVLIDYLSPRYLPVVVRVDPWSQPYKYQGERDHFTLRSLGPDEKENTADDILVNQ
jgi:hypothetical protein